MSDYEVRETHPKVGTSEFYWVLKSANGEVLAVSESYTRREDAERGIEDAKRAAEQASE